MAILQAVPTKVATTLENNPRHLANLNSEAGCSQIRYSNGEFIVDSYALAKSEKDIEKVLKQGAFKGMQLYDTPSPHYVKFDESLNIFWACTGYFD